MDFENTEEDFPGLSGTSKAKKDDPEFQEKEKKDKRDKKDKKDKDKGYATLAGDSSPDEDSRSPSKSTKRIKAFKFPLKKEKREKSRDKDKEVSVVDPPEGRDKDKKKDKKEKEKKEKKVKSSASDDPQELGDVPVFSVFGVPIALALERSRCHDIDNPLPLVVRDCIDYLQEAVNESESTIYKVEPVKAKLLHLKRLYNNRESNGLGDLDIATASGLLKLFLSELPEPLLTTELLPKFEETSAQSDVQTQLSQLMVLVSELPVANRVLLKWISLHLDAVTEKVHNAQSLALILSPHMQMSQRLFVTILCHCRSLFLPPGVDSKSALPKYIPPLTGANPILPESRDDILQELRKQESVLSQIHNEMNSGYVTKRREEQLWEVQRIITQLKRKLRQFDKKGDSTQRSVDDVVDSTIGDSSILKNKSADEVAPTQLVSEETTRLSLHVTDDGFVTLPNDHPDSQSFMRLQLENYELHRLRSELQAAINRECSEILITKKRLEEQDTVNQYIEKQMDNPPDIDEKEIQDLLAQQEYLKTIRKLLSDDIRNEQRKIIDLRVQLSLAQ